MNSPSQPVAQKGGINRFPKNVWGYTILMLVLTSLTGCVGRTPPAPIRIALLAPFEGRYREVGYEALYAARLAFQEQADLNAELLAVDDGGTVDSAIDRARALVQDSQVLAVIALGFPATDAETQRAFAGLPVLFVGRWSARPETETTFLLASSELDRIINIPFRFEVTDAPALQTPVTGDEVLALEQFRKLRSSLDGIIIVSSLRLPDAVFRTRYRSSAEFAPEPGLFAPAVYSVTKLLLTANDQARQNPEMPLDRARLASLLRLRTDGGYWKDADVYAYRYDLVCIERGDDLCLIPAEVPR